MAKRATKAAKATKARNNKSRKTKAAKAKSATRSGKSAAKTARRGKLAAKTRKGAATRKSTRGGASRAASGPQARARAGAPKAGVAASRTARKSPQKGATPVRRPARPGTRRLPVGINIAGKPGPRYDEILSPDALAFLAELHRRFDPTRKRLLAGRAARQARFDAGELPDFLPHTRHIREQDWKVASIPDDLLDRRVEITGPVDRKMIINALNSGASVYMADFEDANSPTWANNLEGQLNLKDRWAGRLAFTDPASGKHYAIGKNPAVLIVRPRGWHFPEQHLLVDGEPISGALFDFGLYYFHNAPALLAQGTGPYFYIPKLESHLEARLWNDVFVHTQERFGHPKGTIKATVLIETLPAAFEMDEILWELRDHITGLNAGRWDYIFSFIKKFRKSSEFVLPDRSQVVMGKAFLRAYALLLIRTCHRRGAFAMGGMAAQIPVKNDPAANEAAFAKVRADKEREANDGHDGTWVAHPDLVPVAKEVFDRLMPKPNQLDKLREDVDVDRDKLLEIHEGTKTDEGFRANIRVGVQYIEAWLRGRGAVPIYNLMEDAATAEISRAQIWQWLTYGAALENGTKVDDEFFARALEEEMERVKGEVGAKAYASGRFPEAIELFRSLSLADEFEEFLTIPAYRLIA
jgi:malate synthase